jgi:hypothetical protein
MGAGERKGLEIAKGNQERHHRFFSLETLRHGDTRDRLESDPCDHDDHIFGESGTRAPREQKSE